MCLSPVHIGGQSFPCGKCDECKLSQELTLGFYGVANLSKYDKVASITLTYDDEHLPLEYNGISIDYERKTYKVVNDFFHRPDSYSDDNSLLSLKQAWKSRDKRYPYVIQSGNINLLNDIRDYQFDGYFEDLPYDSLRQAHFILGVGNIEHLQQWFKNLRQYAHRMLGISRDAFKYTAVLEYGPITCRPHFHVCLFFNDTVDHRLGTLIQLMCQPKIFHFTDIYGKVHELSGWKYGWQTTCNILSSSTPGDDTAHMARYVAKYGKKADKGIHTFEKLHLVPTFRRVTSKGYYDAGKELARKSLMYDIDIDKYPVTIDDDISTDYREQIKYFPSIWDDARKIVRRMKEKQFINGTDSGIKIPWDAVRRCLSKSIEKVSDYEIRYGVRSLSDDELLYAGICKQSSLDSPFTKLLDLSTFKAKEYTALFHEINFKLSDYVNNLFIYKQTIPIYGRLYSKSSILWNCVKSILSTELNDETERAFFKWIQGLGIPDNDESRFWFKELTEGYQHSILKAIITDNVAGYDEPTNID